MGYYNKGLADVRRGSSLEGMRIIGIRTDAVVGGWVATPGVIRDEISQLNTEITSVDKEMISELFLSEDPMGYHVAKPGIAPEILKWYWSVWKPFHTEWLNFKNRHVGFFDNIWGSTWDQVQEYRKRLRTLYLSGQAVGMVFSGPAPSAPREGAITAAGREAWSLVKTLVYVVIVVVGGYLVFQLFQKSGPAIGSFRRAIRV